MANYTIEELCDVGSIYCFKMLLDCVKSGKPFVTYGNIGDYIESKTKIGTIFSIHPGYVAGAMMDEILEYDENAPLLNALVTNKDGMPGRGVSGYIEARYPRETTGVWMSLSKSKKLALVEVIRKKVRNYKGWEDAFQAINGKPSSDLTSPRQFTERDGHSSPGGWGGGESDEHKALKQWVAENPEALSISPKFGDGIPEFQLLSGDLVDVMFTDGVEFLSVEVKSIRSSDDDFERGIYQCVKYREVAKAQELPIIANSTAMLVTERELPNELRTRAKLLKVALKTVLVNKNFKRS